MINEIPGYCPACRKEVEVTPDDPLVCPSCDGQIFVSLDGWPDGVSSTDPGMIEGPPLKVLLAALIEGLDDGVIACDAQGEITLFNRAARDLYGLPTWSMPPSEWADHFDLFHADGTTPVAAGQGPLTWTLEGGAVKNVEIVVAPRNGRAPRSLLVTGRAINRFGGRLGAVIVMHEITERKQEEATRIEKQKRLARQKQALEINDNVVQALVAARWAISSGDVEKTSELISKALDSSMVIVRRDLAEIKRSKSMEPGDFVRERGADARPEET